jgi:hypothetical protein
MSIKKLTPVILILIGIAFQQCTDRDKRGNTDTNNTTSTKNNTDSTRGVFKGDSTSAKR